MQKFNNRTQGIRVNAIMTNRCIGNACVCYLVLQSITLQNILESTVDRGTNMVSLVEVNRRKGTFTNTLRCEFEFLSSLALTD